MNKTQSYMNEHGWTRVGEGGLAGVYSNGTLYVLCDGCGWFASRTPNHYGGWARSYANMLPAMKFADARI